MEGKVFICLKPYSTENLTGNGGSVEITYKISPEELGMYFKQLAEMLKQFTK